MSASTWKQKLYEVLKVVFKNSGDFTLLQVYQTCKGVMSYHYPNNKTIEASIRRNLEELRDDGLVRFVDYRGTYCLLN